MNNTDYWEEKRGKIVSTVGGTTLDGDVKLRGFNLLEYVDNHRYLEALFLAFTGREMAPETLEYWETAFGMMSYPDSRIWCNHIAALAGNAGCEASVATAAGNLATESVMYGNGVIPRVIKFHSLAVQKFEQGETVEQIVEAEVARSGGKFKLPGYSRPLSKGDERLPLLQGKLRSFVPEPAVHEQLALEISRYAEEKYDETINVMGYALAVLADYGLTLTDMKALASSFATPGLGACYVDYIDRPPGAFLPMRCDDVEYTGPAKRELPESYLKSH